MIIDVARRSSTNAFVITMFWESKATPCVANWNVCELLEDTFTVIAKWRRGNWWGNDEYKPKAVSSWKLTQDENTDRPTQSSKLILNVRDDCGTDAYHADTKDRLGYSKRLFVYATSRSESHNERYRKLYNAIFIVKLVTWTMVFDIAMK